MRWSALGLILAIGISCTPPQTQFSHTGVPYVEDDFASYSKPGTAVIAGQAFLKTRGGDVKFGAGCDVLLIPVTPYVKARIDFIRQSKLKLEPADPRLRAHIQKTLADGGGNFEFRNLPAGDYSLYCSIFWMVPGPGGQLKKTGNTAFAELEIKDGETKKVVVTR